MKNRFDQGFTAIELLITLIIGVVLFIAFSQLYAVSIESAASTSNRSRANNIAYEALRIASYQVAKPCVAKPTLSPAVTMPANHNLPKSASVPNYIEATIDCPYGQPDGGGVKQNGISRITVTITYGTPAETVKHAIFKN